MITGTPKTRLIGAAVLALAATVLLAPTASGKPTPRIYENPNQLGSQLDRLQSTPISGQATIAVPPDAFERAVAIHQAELANVPPDAFERAVAIRQAELSQQPELATTRDGGGSVDWGFVAVLSGLAAFCLALAGATVVFGRQRDRTAHA